MFKCAVKTPGQQPSMLYIIGWYKAYRFWEGSQGSSTEQV